VMARGEGFCGIVGRSGVMRELYHLIRKAGESDEPVLVMGEPGTEVELVARAIHQQSARSQRPFIEVDCGLLTEPSLDAKLFGSVSRRGLAGDTKVDVGIFERAQYGTLFLREVCDASRELQTKLVRVMYERQVVRVGEVEPVLIDVRIVSSTTKDIKKRVREGDFRGDLYYRLSRLRVYVPPLRERKDDIPILANHFMNVHATRAVKGVDRISMDAMLALMAHDWPGNLSELDNVICQAVAVCEGSTIELEDLPRELRGEGRHPPGSIDRYVGLPLNEARAEFERRYLELLLHSVGGNVSEAAVRTGLSRSHLHKKLRRYNIDPKKFRP